MPIEQKLSDKAPPIHPGEFLREDFMRPLEMTSTSLAAALKVPAGQITAIVNERKRMTAEMAMRLERYWGMSADFWMKVQMQYDLETAERQQLSRYSPRGAARSSRPQNRRTETRFMRDRIMNAWTPQGLKPHLGGALRHG